MKVEFRESFFESVEKLVWYDTNLCKVWSAVRYDIPLFFKNVWRFRKELYNHQWWDYRYTLEMMYRSLSIMVVKLEKDGIEEDVSRGKKVAKIKRALELLKHKLDDDYVERAEAELGEIQSGPFEFEKMEDGNYQLVDLVIETASARKHNRKVFKRASDMEENEWKELWDIFKGKKFTTWDDFDGSDLRGWWD
jgi:hypothetical protein